jgi:hypothetical protein
MEEHFVRLVFVSAKAKGLSAGEKAIDRRLIERADPEIDRAKLANPNRTECRFHFLASHVVLSR